VNTSLSEGVNQLLVSIHQNETFVFGELPWLISKEEVIQQIERMEIEIDDIDRLVVEGKLSLDPAIKQHVIYKFENEQLVSGEYWFRTTEKDQFDELGSAIKDVLIEVFPEPSSTNLDALDTATVSAEQHESIMWQGSDRSNMQVNLLSNDASEYILQIQLSSPVAERKSLQ